MNSFVFDDSEPEPLHITINTCPNCQDRKKVYVDGKFSFDGDYSHDKINEYIEGFLFGISFFRTYTISKGEEPCEFSCD